MDQCLVDGSPWLFAVTHVLHRFLAPRHPPLALCSLEEQRCSCLLCSSQRAGGGAAHPTCSSNGALRGQWERTPCHRRGSRPCGSAPSKRKRRQSSSSRRAKRTESHDRPAVSTEPTNAPTGSGSNRVGRTPTND